MGELKLYVILILYGFCIQIVVVSCQNLTCNSNDLKALEGFMKGLESSIEGWKWNESSSFSSNCCDWEGILCKSSASLGLKNDEFESGRVVKLELGRKKLSGNLSESVASLDQLKILNLTHNSLRGSIPASLLNLRNLEVLDLSNNDFSGLFRSSVPEELFQLSNLSVLALQNNRLSGELSSKIGNFSNLGHLDISSNYFSGKLPDVFMELNKLWYFSAQSNLFNGEMPRSLSNSGSISLLSLRNNSLSGQIYLNCSAMNNLTSLDLASNTFNGSIPSDLPNCLKLKTINLAKIKFSGQIPESFKNFHSLTSLSFSNSSIQNISSALGILQHCQNLKTLVLTLNFRQEELPPSPSLQFKNLTVLIIASCKLTGTIPQWLGKSSSLQLLDLSWNQLSGTIPPWLGSLSYLFYLDLSNNTFIGEIPQSLTSLQSLISREVSLEEPSPDFPFFKKRNTNVRGFQYNQLSSFPPMVDLSNNFLNGSIWPEFGNLRKLHILNLSNNNLSGYIPADLSGMTSLEALDLSYNNLLGNIPPSLVNLSFLSKFSVAYNKLSGPIPTGSQFPTFPNSSFEGNVGLCGDHAAPCHIPNQLPDGSAVKSKRNTRKIVAMAVGTGLGTVFLLTITYLIIMRTTSRREVDPEKEADVNETELGSRSVVLFQNKEFDKELSLDDILKSTSSFNQANIIGCGGFGLVYKATLPDGTKVAIKRLSGDTGQMDREFQAEVETLSRAQHPNLVQLMGYCSYKNDKLLIYSYMDNGSLDYWLHEKMDGPSSLDWKTRLRIALGAAEGLAYLHQSCEPHILHRDIKSSNILLSDKFVAHLADFGLARLINPYDTHVSTDLVGTLGYIPPEYGQASVATYKGDVYSFGVVLLELLTGRRPMDVCKPRGSRDLISWVLQMKTEKRVTEIFDPFIYDKEHAEEMLLVLEIACRCLSESPKTRPTTQQLVSWLDNIDISS
ncbi:phytosulfokine receptor 1-like [Apium graveolens]|uniref:phytosulfokine receptor 1-like n=1 Tax=Apium graveolens TaxID=4045 RepID=UPI003D797BBD